ncbi:MAG: divergent PAP2 family protein [Clostridia bacterium]|nr:divergent PAP2 family protein [Clostridia bacterium]
MGSFFNNVYLWIAVETWLIAQIIKVINDLIVYKKLNMRRLWGSGGMPSSHAATVMSLTTVVGIINGWDSAIFAVSFIFAIVVMYDAAGVRRAAGKQAKIINQMIEEKGVKMKERLTELLGHTPFEVFMGALLGIVNAWFLYNLWI